MILGFKRFEVFFFNAKQPCLKIVYSFFGFSKVGLGNARI